MSTLNKERFSTFSDFNQYFFGCFDDPKVFDCQDFNLLKVAQEGVKLEYGFRTFFGQPWLVYRSLLKAKGLKGARKETAFSQLGDRSQLIGRPYLLLDVGRYVKSSKGQPVSIYMERIQHALPEKAYVSGQIYPKETPLEYDFSVTDLLSELHHLPISEEEIALYRDLKKTHDRLRNQTRFSKIDLNGIRYAMERFWAQFRMWNSIIKLLKPKVCLFICHYHNEGLILALNRHKVRAIELQHGIIASESIFYVYPPSVSEVTERALFADEIWVYGQFWKDRLLKGVEYPEDRIKVLGYYLFQNTEANQEFIEFIKEAAPPEVPRILVTTQTNLHGYFIAYLEWLITDLDRRKQEALILLKTHPAEDPKLYQNLLRHPQIKRIDSNLEDAFRVADLHLSIFSATLYEACKYGLPNFSINAADREDHVAALVADGISTKVEVGKNVLESLATAESASNDLELFAVFTPSLLPFTHSQAL